VSGRETAAAHAQCLFNRLQEAAVTGRQNMHHPAQFLIQQAGHQPFAAPRRSQWQQGGRQGAGDAVIRFALRMTIGQGKAVTRERDGIRIRLREVAHGRQIRLGQGHCVRRSRVLTQPAAQVGGAAQLRRQAGVVKGERGLRVKECAMLARFLFGIEQGADPREIGREARRHRCRKSAGHKAFANEDGARFKRLDAAVVARAAFDEHEPEKGDALLDAHKAARRIPRRGMVAGFAEPFGDGFDPGGVDAGSGACEQTRGFDKFTG